LPRRSSRRIHRHTFVLTSQAGYEVTFVAQFDLGVRPCRRLFARFWRK
jgi:hypothetical protein